MSDDMSDADGRAAVYDALKTRRRFIAGTAAITTTALAGCGSPDGDDGTPTGTEGSPTDEATPTEGEDEGEDEGEGEE